MTDYSDFSLPWQPAKAAGTDGLDAGIYRRSYKAKRSLLGAVSALLLAFAGGCGVDMREDVSGDLPKTISDFCSNFNSRSSNLNEYQSIDACRKLNLLKDFSVSIDRYYIQSKDISKYCYDNISKSVYFETYNEKKGLVYRNVIEALKNEKCLNDITHIDIISKKYEISIDPKFLLNKFNYYPENQSLYSFFEYENFFSYPIYIAMRKESKSIRIGCLIIFDERFSEKPAEIFSDIDCLQRV